MEYPKCATPGCDYTSITKTLSGKMKCSLCWSREWMAIQVETNQLAIDNEDQLSLKFK